MGICPESVKLDRLGIESGLSEHKADYLYEAGIKTPKYKNTVINFLMGYTDNKELVLKTMEGININ